MNPQSIIGLLDRMSFTARRPQRRPEQLVTLHLGYELGRYVMHHADTVGWDRVRQQMRALHGVTR